MSNKVSLRIEKERKTRRWKYRDLAEFLEVSLSQAHGWATGKHSPNLESIQHIARKFRCSVAELVS